MVPAITKSYFRGFASGSALIASLSGLAPNLGPTFASTPAWLLWVFVALIAIEAVCWVWPD